MANNLYNSMGNAANPYSQIIEQAKQFRANFNGDPKAEVERLLSTGQMSQAQFNQLSQAAQHIVQMMGDI